MGTQRVVDSRERVGCREQGGVGEEETMLKTHYMREESIVVGEFHIVY